MTKAVDEALTLVTDLATLTEVASFASLLISVLALTLAIVGARQLASVQKLSEDAGDILWTMRRELGEFDVRQAAQLEEMGEAVATLVESHGDADPADSDQDAAVEQTDDERAAEYARMRAVRMDEVRNDVLSAVERAADSSPRWALRRRGRGRPRWLIGTNDGGAWRVTLQRGQPSVSPAPTFADQIRPVALETLGQDAVTALREATGVTQEDLEETVYRRQTRGVPVYFAFLPLSDNRPTVWRLVKTRWGWSAAPDDD